MMPISNGICQYVWKDAVLNKNICHFLGLSPGALSGKKFQSIGTYTNDATLCSGVFPAKRARWQSRVLDFFAGFTDKG